MSEHGGEHASIVLRYHVVIYEWPEARSLKLIPVAEVHHAAELSAPNCVALTE
jgi:hypothetical protein